jgi:very-short-patch-repair endonuclease
MDDEIRYPAKTSPKLWEMLKPLARQKRHEPTPAENHLWRYLRNRQVNNTKFRRQHAIDRFIVDFYCVEARLIIEVDGSIHDYTADEDALRQEFLESLGLRVIRFTNDAVLHDIQDVLIEIKKYLPPRTSIPISE